MSMPTPALAESAAVSRPRGGLLKVVTGGASLLLCVSCVGALLADAAFHLFAVPRFVATFEDLDVELPGATVLVLGLNPYVMAAGLLALAAAVVAKEVLIRNRIVTLALNVGLLLVIGAWVVVTLVAVYLPLVQLPAHAP
jgi:type II secretory pathway component PulF